jgi:hypothetical protein
VRILLVVLVAASTAAAAPADDYFELGLDYLGKGFYERARAAFAECLVRTPGEPVPLVFLGVAAAAEGRTPSVCARLLRRGYENLPEGKSIRLDLREQLPSARALALLHARLSRELAAARGGAPRLHLLSVLAFLEVHDGSPRSAPALDELTKRAPDDAYARALRPRKAAA